VYGILPILVRQSEAFLELEGIMKKIFGPLLVLALITALDAVAQRGSSQQHSAPPQHSAPQRSAPVHRGNGGQVPPPPQARPQGGAPEHHTYQNGRVDQRPHVSDNRWYGHDDRNDSRFHVDRPYEHGRFTNFGTSHPYRFARVDRDRHRFWFNGGFGFEIFPDDWEFASGWCWTCPDDIIIYDDPDHPGWYLVYNTETGVYVHAQYIGG
jgi:hypothetical protein